MTINQKQYENYLEGKKNGTIKEDLLDLISDSLEKKVNELDAVFDSAAHDKLKVAAVTFGYKNGNLIRALKARGALIASA